MGVGFYEIVWYYNLNYWELTLLEIIPM